MSQCSGGRNLCEIILPERLRPGSAARKLAKCPKVQRRGGVDPRHHAPAVQSETIIAEDSGGTEASHLPVRRLSAAPSARGSARIHAEPHICIVANVCTLLTDHRNTNTGRDSDSRLMLRSPSAGKLEPGGDPELTPNGQEAFLLTQVIRQKSEREQNI